MARRSLTMHGNYDALDLADSNDISDLHFSTPQIHVQLSPIKAGQAGG